MGSFSKDKVLENSSSSSPYPAIVLPVSLRRRRSDHAKSLGGSDSSTTSGSDSSTTRSVSKYPSQVSFEINSSIENQRPQRHQISPQLSPLDPSVISVRNFRKHLPGIRIKEPEVVQREISEVGSSNFAKEESFGQRWVPGDGLRDLVVESSPYLPSSAKLRSCDVYIGLPGSEPDLVRFAKWLRAELELQGVSCLAADRSKCKNASGHEIVEKAMNSASFGVVIVTKKSFSNRYSMYELTSFLGKKNLVPIFFGLGPADCMVGDIVGRRGELWENHGGNLWKSYGGLEKEWKQAVNALSCMGWNLEAHSSNWRDCISEAALLLGTRLGKLSWVERVKRWKERVEKDECLPFPRNENFVGRKKELHQLELMLFGDLYGEGENECLEFKNTSKPKSIVEKKVEDQQEIKRRIKGKEPVLWKESEEKSVRRKSTSLGYGKGFACVTGDRGIGKTELLLEFAYRFAQRYKMVLWIGGEARYLRQNYLNLLPLLEVDVSMESQLCFERNTQRTFEELEGEAICRVRKELTRDIPFLIVIDNLEREKDWWDARNLMELLPHFGGATHIIISTRLPRIMDFQPLRLSYLSGAASLSLMKGTCNDMPSGEVDALRIIEEKVGRLTFGLSLIGGILSELPISPHRLLDVLNRMSDRELTGDPLFRHNPYLMRLIEVCFLALDQVDKMASRMALASAWFAPSPIPLSLLASASEALEKQHHGGHLWKKWWGIVTCRSLMLQRKRSEEESSIMMVKLGLARSAKKQGYIQFHEIVRLYARKSGDTRVAYAMVRAVNSRSSYPQHNEHIWAACFLLFNFGRDAGTLEPKVSELVSFIKRLALPLAIHTFTKFSRCNAALELLGLCTDALECMEDSQMGNQVQKSVCSGSLSTSTRQLTPTLYQELALLKATLLQKRAELMLQGGDYDIAEQLCRTAISIREVFYGWDHPETISLYAIMDKLVKSQAKSQEM